MSNQSGVYPKVSVGPDQSVVASPSFPAIEKAVLAYWEQDKTFQASIDAREPGENSSNEFVFYDGPPFANGLPHYGHLLTGYAKDVVPRYQTMRGRRVERRFGWDTHGLPAELEAMRTSGLASVEEVTTIGLAAFNDLCRKSVLKYTNEWKDYVTSQARWVDFDNDYKTLDPEYMESVIWAFKELYDRGLIYQGFKVLPYCWNDETPLSNHELRMDDDVYQDRQDLTCTVSFPVVASGHALDSVLDGVELIAWTTTPWTLPTNLSCAVGPDMDYVIVPSTDGRKYLLAADRVGAYAAELGYEGKKGPAKAQAAVIETIQGQQLAGVKYEPLWDYYRDAETWGTENAWQVLVEDYVTAGDGTGVVHQASAYGEEDQRSCEEAGIPVILSVDSRARFLPIFSEGPLSEIAGVNVFDANTLIIRQLRTTGRLLKEASYVHSYPHCWRCRKPLIYKAVSSWFVNVTAIKERMLELNDEIDWVPGNIKDGQFGKWLSNARDWPISRNRFWGSPIPVWVSDNEEFPRVDVYGSFAELERDFGVAVTDLHRPAIDELVRPNPDDPSGQSMMRRVPEVLDCWFESGSMPFAQVHYPFENKDWFESHSPGDFIVEYIGQTRGWFYTLHILSTALFDRPAFKTCVAHGIVLGNDGQKMSKSLRNYPDVNEVFERDGADAMRWFLMASPILRGGNLVVTEQGIRDSVRSVLLPLWSTWYFFSLYANASAGGAGYEAVRVAEADDTLDRYLLAKTGELVRQVTVEFDNMQISQACETVRGYLDVVTNWYVRRSRDRFWGENDDAFNVLYTCLETVCRVTAPLLPLLTEELWRGLTGGRSVHLTDWPSADEFPQLTSLVERMERTMAVCTAASSVRKARNLRVRLPLKTLIVVTEDAAGLSGDYADIMADEVNVQEVKVLSADDPQAQRFGLSQKLTVNARAAGPRLGKQVQQAIKASKSGDWSISDDGSVIAGGLTLEDGEYSLDTVVDEEAAQGWGVAVLPGGGFVALDVVITEDLERVGLARDIIRAVQQARRDADLEVTQRISLTVAGDPHTWKAMTEHQDLVMNETLAVQVGMSDQLDALPLSDEVTEVELAGGSTVRLLVTPKG